MRIKSWVSLKIPRELYNQIKDVIPFLGVPSVAEYVRQTVREWNNADKLFHIPYDLIHVHCSGHSSRKAAARHSVSTQRCLRSRKTEARLPLCG